MPEPQTDEVKEQAAVPAFREVGATGLQRAGGFITEEFLKALRGRQAMQIYREMSDNDPIVGAIMFSIDKLIRNVEWTTQSDNDEQAQFIEECREDMASTWPDLISEIMTMLPYGWSLFELVFKRRNGDVPGKIDVGDGKYIDAPPSKFTDGRIGWSKVASRAQTSMLRWGFNEVGDVTGMVQVPAPDYKERWLPIEKCLLFRTTTAKGNPEGRSILRNAYRPWYFKKRIEEIESIGIERDLAGFPVLYMDPEIMTSENPIHKQAYLEYQKIIRNIRRDQQEGVIFPSVYDENNNKLIYLELLSSGGARSFDTSGIIGRYQAEIAMTVLADFILLGHEAVGSFALSADKTELFAVALGSWLKMIASVFNEVAIPQLLRLNGMPTDQNTILVPGDIDDLPIESLMGFLTQLDAMGAAVFPNDDLVEFLYNRVRLPINKEQITYRAPQEMNPAPTPLEQ